MREDHYTALFAASFKTEMVYYCKKLYEEGERQKKELKERLDRENMDPQEFIRQRIRLKQIDISKQLLNVREDSAQFIEMKN